MNNILQSTSDSPWDIGKQARLISYPSNYGIKKEEEREEEEDVVVSLTHVNWFDSFLIVIEISFRNDNFTISKG